MHANIINITAIKKINYLTLVKEATVAVAGATVLPLAFHFIPTAGAVPIGARFLPMHYAPFIALAFFPFRTAIMISALAPYLNHFLTGNPKDNLVLGLTLHLALYSFVCYVLERQFKKSIFNAPSAYILSLFLMQLFWHYLGYFNLAGTFSAGWKTFLTGLPGVGVLFLLNILLNTARRK